MKINNKIAVAALVAMGFVSQVQATDPEVYLTGSTAFRATAFLALSASSATNSPKNLFDSNTVSYVTYGNSAAKSANFAVFHGTIGGAGVYVNVRWSGSEAGIASACNTSLQNVDRNNNPIALAGSPAAWLDATQFNSTLLTSGNISVVSTNPPNSVLENNGTPFHGADLAEADTSQGVSWTPDAGSGVTHLHNYGIEGIVTFALCKNYNSTQTSTYSNVVNITMPQYNLLLTKGKVSASFLTGNTNDTIKVYLVGRNLGSGTRMNQLADSAFGPHNGVLQYSIGYGVDPNDPGQSTNTLLLQFEGNNGYESGGGVAEAIDQDGSLAQTDPIVGGTGWMAIGYAGPSDIDPSSASATVPHPLGPSYWLTLGGVPTLNGTIENGQDWLWGAEHLYGKNGISGTQDTVGNALYTAVVNQIAAAGYGTNATILDPAIPLPLMKASKQSDTAFPVAPGTMTQFKY